MPPQELDEQRTAILCRHAQRVHGGQLAVVSTTQVFRYNVIVEVAHERHPIGGDRTITADRSTSKRVFVVDIDSRSNQHGLPRPAQGDHRSRPVYGGRPLADGDLKF